jgi:gliding motility-associated-like protein
LGTLTTPQAGNDTTVCAGSAVTLKGNTPGGGETATWQAAGPATVTNAGITGNLQVGGNKFWYTLDNGSCNASDTVVVNVDQDVTQPSLPVDTAKTCGSSYVLNATAPSPGTGVWSIKSGQGSLVLASDPATTLDNLTSAGYTTLLWSVQNGVCPAKKDSMVVEKAGNVTTPVIKINGDDVTETTIDLCLSSTNTITVNGPNTGNGETGAWSNGGGTSVTTPVSNSEGLTLNSTGQTILEYTITPSIPSCSPEMRKVTINVNDVPAQPGPVTGPTGTLCSGTSDLSYWINSVPTATKYKWSVVSGTGITIQAPQSGVKDTLVKVNLALTATSGVIEVADSNACGLGTPRQATITVTPTKTPAVSITSDVTTLCADSSAKLSVSSVSSETTSPAYQWYKKSNGTTTTLGTSATYTASGLQTGDSLWVEMTSDYACAAPNPVLSNKIGYKVNPMLTVSVAITDDHTNPLCAGTQVTFTADTTNGHGGTAPTFAWTVDNGTPASGSQRVFTTTLSANSTVNLTMTSNAICPINPTASKSVTLIVTPNATPNVTLSPTTEQACEDQQPGGVFTATPTGVSGTPTYSWSMAGNPVTGSGANYTPQANLAAGTYKVSVIMTVPNGGCYTKRSDTATSAYTVNALPPALISGPTVFCPGATIQLNAPNGYNYQWYGGNVSGQTGQNIVVSQAGSYSVLVTDPTTNCKQTSSAYPVTQFTPSASVVSLAANGDSVKCIGMQIDLQVQGNGSSYYWYRDGALLSQTSSTIPVVTAGVYTGVVVGGPSCRDSASIQVIDVPVPTPVINEGDGVICNGESYPLTVSTGGGTVKWYRDNFLLSGVNGSSYSAMDAGSYQVVEDNGHCTGSSNYVLVEVEKVPVAEAGTDKAVKAGEAVMLSGSGSRDAYGYHWSSPTYSSGAFDPNPDRMEVMIRPDSSVTLFYLTVSSLSGRCSSTDSLIVRAEIPIKVWNSLSPNGDRQYDDWIIENIENFPNALVEVYNRWGNLVWQSKGYKTPWHGENFRNNEPLPIATYYYIIYPNGQAVTDPITGDVTIVK